MTKKGSKITPGKLVENQRHKSTWKGVGKAKEIIIKVKEEKKDGGK